RDSGLLIVTTTAAIQQRLDALRTQLDTPLTEQTSRIRFYKLTNTTAADVLATIRSLENSEQATGSSANTPGTLSDSGASPQSTNGTSASTGQNAPAPANPSSTTNNLLGLSNSYSNPIGSTSAGNGNVPAQAIIGVHTAKGTITADPNTNSIIVDADPP